ncbi:MAG: hypothetical protein ACRD0C_01820 [Acidimicrobiia bacterium]
MTHPRSTRPRCSRPTDLSPGPSQVGFEFLLWRYGRLEEKRVDEFLLAKAEEQLRLEREREIQ